MKPSMYRIKEPKISGGYKRDSERVQRILEEHGCKASLVDSYRLWKEMSTNDYCAGWLILPKKDEQVFEMLLPYLEKIK